jgi:hypothetical protein
LVSAGLVSVPNADRLACARAIDRVIVLVTSTISFEPQFHGNFHPSPVRLKLKQSTIGLLDHLTGFDPSDGRHRHGCVSPDIATRCEDQHGFHTGDVRLAVVEAIPGYPAARGTYVAIDLNPVIVDDPTVSLRQVPDPNRDIGTVLADPDADDVLVEIEIGDSPPNEHAFILVALRIFDLGELNPLNRLAVCLNVVFPFLDCLGLRGDGLGDVLW